MINPNSEFDPLSGTIFAPEDYHDQLSYLVLMWFVDYGERFPDYGDPQSEEDYGGDFWAQDPFFGQIVDEHAEEQFLEFEKAQERLQQAEDEEHERIETQPLRHFKKWKR